MGVLPVFAHLEAGHESANPFDESCRVRWKHQHEPLQKVQLQRGQAFISLPLHPGLLYLERFASFLISTDASSADLFSVIASGKNCDQLSGTRNYSERVRGQRHYTFSDLQVCVLYLCGQIEQQSDIDICLLRLQEMVPKLSKKVKILDFSANSIETIAANQFSDLTNLIGAGLRSC